MTKSPSALHCLADRKPFNGALPIKKFFTLFLIFVFVCVAALPLAAQTITTGQLTGTVTDPAGAMVANSQLTLTSDATGETQTATTGSSGEFRFPLLRPGVYTLAVSAPGFEQITQKATVSLGQSAALNLQLGVQRQSTTVNVSEQAPLLQSDNANLATSFDTNQLQNLPAPGNDMTAYAFNTPGVTISTGGGYGSFSAFGLPAVSNLFTVNGNDNMDPYLNLNNSGASNLTLGSNELSEAAVVINGYTGQYGRQAGANVNYVTKSGTNDWHGNASWLYNGRVMNANDWFNNATGTPRPFSVSNEWAASFGGPIIKNKLFGFIDNEGLRYVLPGGGPVYIPTTQFADYVIGNLTAKNPAALPFYQKAFGLYANSSGASRATNVTDPGQSLGCGDFAAAGFGDTLPCARTFRSTVNSLNTEWLLAARVDYVVSSKDRIYFRYNTDHGVQATGTDPINAAFNANSVQPSYGGQFGYTRVINASMVNDLHLSASYYTAIFGPPDLNAALNTFPTTFTFTDGLYTNLGGDNNTYPQGRKVRQWQLVDDYSINAGRHTIKFGVNARKNFISTYAYGAGTSGLFTFASMNDFVNGALSKAGGSNYAQTFSSIGAQSLTLYSLGFYGQDEWKVRPNLTLTLAMRLDRNSNIQCGVGCFNELVTQPFGQLAHSATTPYNATIQTGLKQAFPSVEPIVPEPRIGFAWNASKSTVVRGGFGIFSDLYQGLIADRLITNSPSVASFTATSGLVAQNDPNSAFARVANSYNAFRNGFASGQTLKQLQTSVPGFTAPNFNTVANRLYNPKYYEWNFEVQQGFLDKYLFSLNYVGNHGYQEINQTLFANAYSPSGFQGLPTAAPDSRFSQIRELNNNGFSNYNGMVASLRWRPVSNFTGSVSYTWGHALDTCSNSCLEPFNFLTAASFRYQVNPLGLRVGNYGNADYDVRHSLNANYVYTVPTSYFHNWALKQLVGGWTVAGTLFFHTGYPFSVVNSGVRSGQVSNVTGIATQLFPADYIGGTSPADCTTPNVPCYSTSQFAAAGSQHDFGNLGRNSFRGPGYFNTDLNV
ncbi:MAG: carboxypeptidase regulatory-like domain-containing protein, partial [Bryobacteraceae bacterium]